MPPPEPDRAGSPDADGGAGGRAVVRRIERDRPGGSAGVAGAAAAQSIGGGPAGEGPQSDAARRENQGGHARTHDIVASDAGAIVRGRPASAGEDPAAPARVTGRVLLRYTLLCPNPPIHITAP